MIYNFKLGFQLDCSFYDYARSKAFDFAPVPSLVCVREFWQETWDVLYLTFYTLCVCWISEHSRKWVIQVHHSRGLERAVKLNKMQRGLWWLATPAGFHPTDFYKYPFTHLIKFSVLIWVAKAKLLLRNSSPTTE